jgi:EAL domain-containing protein (putative c-di-GMP-specific phosphodiesterase class I)
MRRPRLPEIRNALHEARIRAVYQPVVRMRDRMPVYLEVLARLDDPALGSVAPDLFVPEIENAGLSFGLTREVVARAFADWGGDRLERHDLSLALNVPLDVLVHPAMPAWLDEERETAGIAAGRIWIELTESLPVTDVADLGHAVASLRDSGYSLAIDDVGPGVREAEPLLGLGFSALKLDKGLVQGSRDEPKLAALLARTVAAAHGAGLSVVAEGVEDGEMWQRMLAAGVEEAQGYLIARPMPAGDVARWHHAWQSGAVPGADATTI